MIQYTDIIYLSNLIFSNIYVLKKLKKLIISCYQSLSLTISRIFPADVLLEIVIFSFIQLI